MNALYPNLDFAVPSAPPAIEEKACSVDWTLLPKAEEPRWYQVTKIRHSVANTLFGASALSGAGTFYAGVWLIAEPIVVIGAFSSLAVVTGALAIAGVAFYALSESPLDPECRLAKRLEAYAAHKKGELSFREMKDYGQAVLQGDEIQELLRYDIQTHTYQEFIDLHGEEAIKFLTQDALTSLKIRYLAHLGEHDAGHNGLQEVLQRATSRLFGVSLQELASDFIKEELYRLYRNQGSDKGSHKGSYAEFIERNGREAISYVTGSNYKEWFINKFLEMPYEQMTAAAFADDRELLAISHEEIVATMQGRIEKMTLEEVLQMLMGSCALFTDGVLHSKTTLVSGDTFGAALEAYISRVSRLTDLVARVPKELILQSQNKQIASLLVAFVKEQLSDYVRGTLDPSYREIIEMYPLPKQAKEVMAEAKNRYHIELKRYQAEVEAFEALFTSRMHEAGEHKQRVLSEANARFGLDSLAARQRKSMQTQREQEQVVTLLESKLSQLQKETASLVREQQAAQHEYQHLVAEQQRIALSGVALPHRLLQLKRQRDDALMRQRQFQAGPDIAHLRTAIAHLETKVQEQSERNELQLRQRQLQRLVGTKAAVQSDLEHAERSITHEAQGIVQAVRAHSKNKALDRTIEAKKRKLHEIEEGEREQLLLAHAIARAVSNVVLDPDLMDKLAQKRQELAYREQEIISFCNVAGYERQYSEAKELAERAQTSQMHLSTLQRDMDARNRRQASQDGESAALHGRLAFATQALQQAQSEYLAAQDVYTSAYGQCSQVEQVAEKEFKKAKRAIQNEAAKKRASCLTEHERVVKETEAVLRLRLR